MTICYLEVYLLLLELGNLSILSLSVNKLSGPIPYSFGNLQQLTKLYLRENELNGSIPRSLGNCKNLVLLNLSHNSLEGSIPSVLLEISSLSQYLDLSHNRLTGLIPEEVSELINLGTFNISDNQLSGQIPSSLGQCAVLESIRMEHNLFQGSIPQSLVNLRGLKEIDISQNNMSGEIPEFLASLPFLQYLNLSFNNFSGAIPTIGIFANASVVSVQGNKRLCTTVPILQLPLCSPQYLTLTQAPAEPPRRPVASSFPEFPPTSHAVADQGHQAMRRPPQAAALASREVAPQHPPAAEESTTAARAPHCRSTRRPPQHPPRRRVADRRSPRRVADHRSTRRDAESPTAAGRSPRAAPQHPPAADSGFRVVEQPSRSWNAVACGVVAIWVGIWLIGLFNPSIYRIYDYVNGVRDVRNNKVCTVIPAHVSFKEDSARILRGLRIAARLGFQFSSETSTAIQDLSSSIINIDKTRLMMEMKYMLSHGAAESSVRLLRKYGLLDILLPFQAAYLSDQIKGKSSDRDLMLMKLLANLDKLLSADRPCHCSLWLALLAFHSALVNSPQDALAIRAFAALLYFGTWESTIKFLKQDIGAPAPFVPETLGPSGTNLMEQTSRLASLVNSSVDTLTCLDALQQSLARYSEVSQFSGVVFVSDKEGRRLLRIFEGLDSDLTSYNERRGMREIDYELLKDGHPGEVRFVLGKVIMDTMSDESPCASTEDLADGSHPPLSSLYRSGESY